MMTKIIQEDLEFITNNSDIPWSNLDNSTVLIVGSNSYLASYLIETLLYLNDKYNKNIKVIGLTRNKEKSILKYHHHKDRKDLEFIFQDVIEPILCIKNLRKVNYIIHAASQASHKYYYLDPVGTLNSNTLGTINLLNLAKDINNINNDREKFKGFLFFSSGMVYGKIEDKDIRKIEDKDISNIDNCIPMKENSYGYLDPLDINSCYAESKKNGETICKCYHHQYNIPTKIVRISHVFGPGMDLLDERVYHSFLSGVINNRNIIMKSDGSSTRDFIYIADATLAFLTVLLKGKCGEAYNVGTEKETSILELANILRDLSGKKIEIIQQVERNDKNRSCFNISKIKTLGWKPVYDLKEGSKRTLEHYKLINI